MTASDAERFRAVLALQQEIVATSLRPADALRLIVSRVPELTSAAAAAIELRQGGELVTVAAAGTGRPEGTRLPLEGNLAATCFRSASVHSRDEAAGGSVTCLPLVSRGEVLGVLEAVSPQPLADADIEILRHVCLVAAMSAREERTLEHLEQHRRHDAVTGLPNSRAYEDQLINECERCARYAVPFSLAQLELRGLEHTAMRSGGDAERALVSAATSMSASLRAADCRFRIGDIRFAILMPNTTEASAKTAVERLVARMAAERAMPAWVGIASAVSESEPKEKPQDLHRRVEQTLEKAEPATAAGRGE